MNDEPYPYDFSGDVGITFHLPSRRRFIPNCWLLHADVNERGAELQIHYTQWLVTINGTDLSQLHGLVTKNGVSFIRELTFRKAGHPSVSRIEVTASVSE